MSTYTGFNKINVYSLKYKLDNILHTAVIHKTVPR